MDKNELLDEVRNLPLSKMADGLELIALTLKNIEEHAQSAFKACLKAMKEL